MKDNFSLIAAATGGFMLSVALTGILHGAPVTSLQSVSHVNSGNMANFQIASGKAKNTEMFRTKTH
ncbi:MAG: hypothetical protein QNJ47_07800 [Nostocaceae cyanobacterium]|nr:hypothetical protein [Nostocaceae cyanobacterium]